MARTARAAHGTSAAGAPDLSGPWHALPVRAVLRRLQTSMDGLDPDEARARLERDGPNRLQPPARRQPLATLLSQFKSLPALLLLGSSGFSTALGEGAEAAAILTVLGLNGAIGWRIERQNEQVLDAWRREDAGQVNVLRGGALTTVPEAELVRGDVLLCHAGQLVPADARVLASDRLACDESTLTGESEPRDKDSVPVPAGEELADRSSMLFAGTTIASGRGRAVVTGTALASARGSLQKTLESVATHSTPLEKRFGQLADRIAWGGLAAGAAGALAGWLRARPLGAIVRTGVALGVAAIPEGLPLVATAALVRAMRRLRERGIVVRRLASAETLGGVDVICTDKTGTLTENDMRLLTLHVGERSLSAAALRADPARELRDPVTLALVAGVLNSDVDLVTDGNGLEVAGSSTERALVRAASSAGLDPVALRARYPRRLLAERRPGRDYVVSVHDSPGGGRIAFAKGAPEQVVRMCSREAGAALRPARRGVLLERASEMAADGCRVLALGWRWVPPGGRVPREGYTLLGLAGLADPLRPNGGEAVRAAGTAGIRTLLLTGDHRRTAEAIARAVGLEGEVVEGSAQVQALLRGPDEAFARVSVFARVGPQDKLAIVQRLRARGHVVAMAGDGINDAPALKAAHVGIAVGDGSSDLARQAADLVLENGDLRSLLSAIDHGRVVQDNLRRALQFLLATNASEILLVLGATLAGVRQALTPMQLLWINLVSDTLPALALALQPEEDGLPRRQPARSDAPLITNEMRRRIAVDAALMAGLGAVGLVVGGQPLAFGALSAAQLGYVLACRTPGVKMDRQFAGLWLASLVIQALALWLPPIRRLLGLPAAASALELGGFGAAFLLPLMRSAADRVIVRHGPAYRPQSSGERASARARVTGRTKKRSDERWRSILVPSCWAGAPG